MGSRTRAGLGRGDSWNSTRSFSHPPAQILELRLGPQIAVVQLGLLGGQPVALLRDRRQQVGLGPHRGLIPLFAVGSFIRFGMFYAFSTHVSRVALGTK